MKLFKPEEKEQIINEFNKRHGIYSRLYLNNDINIPTAIIYRCESNIDKLLYLLVYYRQNIFNSNEKVDFENDLLIGMNKILSKDKQMIEIDNCKIFKQSPLLINNKSLNFFISSKSASKYIYNFAKRAYKYYKEERPILMFVDEHE